MTEERQDDFPEGQRSEPRTIVDRFFSVEFYLKDAQAAFRYKIWNISRKGICLVVREDSDVLKHMKKGDMLDMKFYPPESPIPSEPLRTEVIHISPDETGRFKGHCLVGLSILEGQITPVLT